MRYKPMTIGQYKFYCIFSVIIGILAVIGCAIIKTMLIPNQAMIYELITIVVFLIIFAGLDHKMAKYRR